MKLVGLFMNLAEADSDIEGRKDAFKRGLTGFTEGHNVRLDYRYGAGDFPNYRRLAKQLISLRNEGRPPDVIFSGCGPSWRALEAEMASLVFRIDVGDTAPDAVGAIAEFGFEAEGFANGGMNAIAGDDEVRFGRGSIFKVKKDRVGALFEAREGVVQVNEAAGDGLGERGLEVGAMNGDAVAIGGGERESFDVFAAGIFHQKAAERAAASLEPGKNIRVNFIEGSDGVGPEAHA